MHLKIRISQYFLLISSSLIISCSVNSLDLRSTIDLSGNWQFRTDAQNIGINEKWNSIAFEDSVSLPGTLDENKKGSLNQDSTDLHLNRIYAYVGAAWFKKEIVIPETWTGKHIELIMERTKVTHVWMDTLYLGTNNTIFSKQVYDLTGKITSGKHMLTIMVDNTLELVPVAGSHAYEEHTQTNWNGIIGRFCLEASNPTRLARVRVTPDIHSKQIKVQISIENMDSSLNNADISLRAESWNTPKKHKTAEKKFNVLLSSTGGGTTLTYNIGEKMQLWSEFDPALYKLFVTLSNNGQILDNAVIDFGMREFKTKETQFAINDITTFLRGKQDACVFPHTGYPPMNPEGWTRVFRIAISYGLNHYRFHSWCPPEAAFEAADICGIYLQPELPIWWGFQAQDSAQVSFMIKEGTQILDNYGNYASFVMFALGNEIGQDRNVLKQIVDDLRAHDNRHLYAQGSNNRLWDPSLAEGDDYWTTFRIAKERPDHSSDVRGSMSFLDSKDGGIINATYPSTRKSFSKAIKEIPVPVIGHETGQYQIYPNYDEMAKYTGILKPWNFEIFQKGIQEKGMLDQAEDFFKASGKLSVICYREEIEMAIRTPGFGGFQLLDLQDFPGQGTALVGVLDAFMDSKGLITPEEFRQFCNDVVVLLIMNKYSWTTDETLTAEIQIANYSESALTNKTVNWHIVTSSDDTILQSDRFFINSIPDGGITSVGYIEINLSDFRTAQKVNIKVEVADTDYKTTYPVWIYPAETNIEIPEGITVTNDLNSDIMNQLKNGNRVLVFPDHKKIQKKSVGGLFIPDFWNYAMFKSLAKQYGGGFSPGTLGILTDPSHPVFNDFPTASHSNWQWWSIVKKSRPLILDKTDIDYRPIIQVIDNINRNHKLGLLFEFKVGEGKLLVCMADLPAITYKPEARQLYSSILKYMVSDLFNPSFEISVNAL